MSEFAYILLVWWIHGVLRVRSVLLMKVKLKERGGGGAVYCRAFFEIFEFEVD